MSLRHRFGIALVAILVTAAAMLAGCAKTDPEESFRLWMNNEAGWAEMSKYVADKSNGTALRVKALEILVSEGGQPSQVLNVVENAPDRTEVLIALQPAMFKLLTDGNPKKQAHGKKVLFDIMKDNKMPADKIAELKQGVAKWAFGDLSPDDPVARISEKLKDRIMPEEIETLGVDAVPGAEIMLSKGLAKGEVLAFLKGLKSPVANKAIVNGLRNYHSGTKNVKITDDELGALQSADNIESLMYFLELYLELREAKHPDDKHAAELSVRVALEWTDPDDKTLNARNKKLIKESWSQISPLFEKLLVSSNCDDRWWAAQMFTLNGGLNGLTAALAKLPDDDLYGRGPPHGDNDVQMMLTNLCLNEIKNLGDDAVRPLLDGLLKSSPRLIDRVISARCLLALGDPASVAALKSFNKKDPLGIRNVQPLINVDEPLSLTELVAVAADVSDYLAGVDKLAAEGKIDAATAKWRKYYANFSFERRTKTLVPYAEGEAAAKVEKDKAKKAAAPAK